jgi:hypothetical protein
MAGKAGEKNVCNLSDQIRGSRYINFKTTTDGYKTAAGAMNASLAFPCALMFFCSEKTEYVTTRNSLSKPSGETANRQLP